MPERFEPQPEAATEKSDFEVKKRQYFTSLAAEMRGALKLHRKVGLWDKEDSWKNVSEHCLVEAARAGSVARQLGLSPEVEQDLKTAAALHDFYKKGETELVRAEGPSWSSFERASAESSQMLTDAGFSDRVVRLATSVGHGSLVETERILEQPGDLPVDDLAFLVMHYIDDYTVGSDWAEPVEEVDGGYLNSLDQRMSKNEANSRYATLNEEGRERFGGRTTFETQRDVGHRVEEKLASLVSQATGETVAPQDLPLRIDQQIRAEIESRP